MHVAEARGRGTWQRHVAHARWLQAVHTETSTGMVNDLPMLRAIAARRTAGARRHRQRRRHSRRSDRRVVRQHRQRQGPFVVGRRGHRPAHGAATARRVGDPSLSRPRAGHRPRQSPCTQSAIPIDALATSLEVTAWPVHVWSRARDGRWLRGALERAGFNLVAPPEVASPDVHTLALPANLSASTMGELRRARRWLVRFESGNPRARNWLQVGLLGEHLGVALRRYRPGWPMPHVATDSARGAAWPPHDRRMAAAWPPHGCRIAVAWLSHGCRSPLRW